MSCGEFDAVYGEVGIEIPEMTVRAPSMKVRKRLRAYSRNSRTVISGISDGIVGEHTVIPRSHVTALMKYAAPGRYIRFCKFRCMDVPRDEYVIHGWYVEFVTILFGKFRDWRIKGRQFPDPARRQPQLSPGGPKVRSHAGVPASIFSLKKILHV